MGEFILNGRNYGGSIITPNPSDTPTDNLNSIKINDTTYEIQGGGSSIYAGINVPTNSSGEENDLYLRYGALNVDVINNTNVTYTKDESHPLDLTSFLANSHNSFDFEIQGKASSTAAGEEVMFATYGLAEGKQYTITFTGKFASGNVHDAGWASYFYVGIGGDYSTYIQLADDNNSHDYTITFTAGEVNTFRFGFHNLHPERTYTFTVTSFNIEGIFNSGWYEIYGKIENNWSKYVGDESGSSEVIPNPQGEPTDTLNTVGIDGTIYGVNGGTDVIPNPQGEATDTLHTVGIDGTIYGIEGEGGSNLILDAQRYSLEEQVVGIWTDGKPLYEITLPITQALSLSANSWAQTQFDKDVKENIIRATIVLTAVLIDNLQAGFINNKVALNCPRTVRIEANVGFLVLQYTKTTDIAGSGGYQAYGFSPIIYSDTEREVGVWRDNKPLYQKTFYLASCSGVEDPLVADLSSLGIETIVSGSGMCLNVSNYVIPINYAHQNSTYDVTWLVNDLKTRLELRLGSGQRTLHDIYITLQYTKASDTAGSGEYNTLAIPNVHYSTDEQVIGTWIDGKTLYQKTKIFPNTIDFSNDTVLDMEISNVDTIFVEEGFFYDFYVNAIGKLPYSQDGNLEYTISVKVDISNKSHLKISSNTTFGVKSDRYIVVTVRYTKNT